MGGIIPDEFTSSDLESSEYSGGLDYYRDRQEQLIANQPTDYTMPEGKGIPWARFQERNPDYDAELWEECRALYAGGPRLLRDKKLMTRLHPQHAREDKAVYEERCRRAHYFPYAGAIIDHLIAGLAADPISIKSDDEESIDPWWVEFFGDVSPKGGKRQPLTRLLAEQVREALIVRTAWTLVDLPQTPEEYVENAPNSLLAQERAGLLDPYMIAIKAESVLDWQVDSNNELEWALICDTEQRRDGVADVRDKVIKTFTQYDRYSWTRWQIEYSLDEKPEPDTIVPFLDQGAHSFGKVPMRRLDLSEALWAMGKLESLAREHFNKRNAQAWAEYKSLFSILYEFLAPEEGTHTMPISAAQENPDRGIDQVRGQGYSQIRGHQDNAKHVGPDVAPFVEARASCDQIMREMFRVMFSMALSADMGSQAMRRSGESKGKDEKPTTVIVRALGMLAREHVEELFELVSVAKGIDEAAVVGGEKFNDADVAAAVKQAVDVMNGIPIKSATFKKAYLLRTYKTVMGDELDPEDIEKIKDELENQITAEDMIMEATTGFDDTEAQSHDDDEEDEDDTDAAYDSIQVDPEEDEKKATGKTSRRPMFTM